MGLRDRLLQAGVRAASAFVDGTETVLGAVAEGAGTTAAILAKGDPEASTGSRPPPTSGRTQSGNRSVQMPPTEPPTQDPQALQWDPFALVEQLGYKEKPSAITFGTLQAMVWKLPIVNAIIQTRVNQVSQFASPQHNRFDVGFRIRLRDLERKPSRTEQRFMERMEAMLLTTGVTKDPRERESFESFMRKLTRDTLVYDQMCHPAGTLVEGPNGATPIEDVQVGDLLRTHEGRLRRVADLKQRTYSGDLVALKARGQTVNCTTGHPLLVLKNRWAHLTQYRAQRNAVEWIAAEDVQEGHYLAYPRPRLQEDVVETPFGELTADLARVLGLYVADGHVSGGSALVFTLHEDELEYVEYLQDWARGQDLYCVVDPYEDRAAISVRISVGRERAAWVKRSCGGAAGVKQVPDFLFCTPSVVREAFLAGYLEGDGCFRPTKAIFTTTSLKLFHGLRTLFAATGTYVSKVERAEGGLPGSGWSRQYAGNLSGQNYRDFARRCGLPVVEPSKPREPCLVTDKFFLLRVNSVSTTPVEDLPVFNFEVEEDHSYIANGFISHNCFEIVSGRDGRPAEWYAVDAATIRLTDTYRLYQDTDSMRPKTVQIFDQAIINEFTRDELAFCIRNPRTDIRSQGYGTSELEMLVSTITHLLWAQNYNANFFSQGTVSKGVLNLKGTIPEKQLRAFRRQWYQMVAGVENAWRTPIINAEDVEWVDMQRSNRDMEFSAWIDWLIKVATAVYQMDPVEVNFKYGGGQGKSIFESGDKSKLVQSKDKGLKPLLRFFARELNKYIIWPINPDFELEFVGLEAMTPKELSDLQTQRVRSIYTVDEIRAENDLDPLPDGLGQILLDPVWQAEVARRAEEPRAEEALDLQEKQIDQQLQIARMRPAGGTGGGAKKPGGSKSSSTKKPSRVKKVSGPGGTDKRSERKITPEDKERAADSESSPLKRSMVVEVEV